ncbi:MAG TPA: guanine deaminase [Candidatus Cloacimonetes bacterium]|nr:guanine deaminase [Candidatus Cloacimonadota bacterium]HEX38131.1 guanine deaminase [Candidatus Cloacimonadota bacterium]
MKTLIKGTLISPISKEEVLFLDPGYIVINNEGKIDEIYSREPDGQYPEVFDFSDKLICPGFVDIHNHLPQFTISGLYRGNLLEWLNNIVFPTEERFANAEIAEKYAREFFQAVLRNGTTTTVSYVTIHKKATDKAFEQAEKVGIRAFLGNVLMDQKAPEYLTKNSAQLLEDSEEIVKKWDGMDKGRLHYVLTPRFALSCSFDLLEGIGKLAQKYDLYIQSHLAESKAELEMVSKIYSDFENYTDIYMKAGLLTEKTIMAHCIYLNPDEIDTLNRTGTKISHCPSSNRFLQSGIMPFRKLEKAELSIGLGSDVGAGYSLSMFSEMREAIESSKMIKFLHPEKEYSPLSSIEAFYLATLGGAKALSLEDEIGSLDVGKSADFSVIDYQKLNPCNEDFFNEPENIIARMIYGGAEKYIEKVFIRGKEVFRTE